VTTRVILILYLHDFSMQTGLCLTNWTTCFRSLFSFCLYKLHIAMSIYMLHVKQLSEFLSVCANRNIYKSGPKFTGDLRTILRQFSDLRESYDLS